MNGTRRRYTKTEAQVWNKPFPVAFMEPGDLAYPSSAIWEKPVAIERIERMTDARCRVVGHRVTFADGRVVSGERLDLRLALPDAPAD